MDGLCQTVCFHKKNTDCRCLIKQFKHCLCFTFCTQFDHKIKYLNDFHVKKKINYELLIEVSFSDSQF